MKLNLTFLLLLIASFAIAQDNKGYTEQKISKEDFLAIKSFIYPGKDKEVSYANMRTAKYLTIDTVKYLTLKDGIRLAFNYSNGYSKFTCEDKVIVISVLYSEKEDSGRRIYQLSREWADTVSTKEGGQRTAKSKPVYKMLFFDDSIHPANIELNKLLEFTAIVKMVKERAEKIR